MKTAGKRLVIILLETRKSCMAFPHYTSIYACLKDQDTVTEVLDRNWSEQQQQNLLLLLVNSMSLSSLQVLTIVISRFETINYRILVLFSDDTCSRTPQANSGVRTGSGKSYNACSLALWRAPIRRNFINLYSNQTQFYQSIFDSKSLWILHHT